jgi:hypothetical protein
VAKLADASSSAEAQKGPAEKPFERFDGCRIEPADLRGRGRDIDRSRKLHRGLRVAQAAERQRMGNLDRRRGGLCGSHAENEGQRFRFFRAAVFFGT